MRKAITYHIQACYVQLYLVVCVSKRQCRSLLCEESDDTPDDTSD